MSVQVLTSSPVAITGLSDSTRYKFQYRGKHLAFIESATSAPSGTDSAFVMKPYGEPIEFTKTNGSEIYASTEFRGNDEKPAPSVVFGVA